MKMKYGQACENIVPTKLRNVFEADVLNLLPTRDQHGRRLLVLEAGSKFPSLFPQRSAIFLFIIAIYLYNFFCFCREMEAIAGAVAGSVPWHSADRAGLHGGTVFTDLWRSCHS